MKDGTLKMHQPIKSLRTLDSLILFYAGNFEHIDEIPQKNLLCRIKSGLQISNKILGGHAGLFVTNSVYKFL